MRAGRHRPCEPESTRYANSEDSLVTAPSMGLGNRPAHPHRYPIAMLEGGSDHRARKRIAERALAKVVVGWSEASLERD
jgi:hypothetical protein